MFANSDIVVFGTLRVNFSLNFFSPARSPFLTPSASCDGSPVSTPGHSRNNSLIDLSDLSPEDFDGPCIGIKGSHLSPRPEYNSQNGSHLGYHRPTFSVPVTIPRSANISGTPLVERLSPDNKPRIQHKVQLSKGQYDSTVWLHRKKPKFLD